MKHNPDQETNLLLSPSTALNESNESITFSRTSAASDRRLVIAADPRDFTRGCLSSWLGELRDEFTAIVVPNVTKRIAVDAIQDAAVAVLHAGAKADDAAWLRQQVACLRERKPDIPILAVFEDGDFDAVERRLEGLGIRGYIPTSSSLELAAAVLRLVLAGGSYYPRVRDEDARATPAEETRPRWQPEMTTEPKLTPRERVVFELLAQGMPNKIIAYRLGMSISTVKIHVHHIIQKLKVHNRTEVAVMGRAARTSEPLSLNGLSHDPRPLCAAPALPHG